MTLGLGLKAKIFGLGLGISSTGFTEPGLLPFCLIPIRVRVKIRVTVRVSVRIKELG